MNKTVTPEEAILRVMRKRLARGASTTAVKSWLVHLRDEVYGHGGATHKAVVALLRNFDKHAPEPPKPNALLAIELTNYRQGWAACVTEQQQAEHTRLAIAKIRAVIEQEGV